MTADKLTVYTLPGDRSEMWNDGLEGELRKTYLKRMDIIGEILRRYDLHIDDLAYVDPGDFTEPKVRPHDFCGADDVALAQATAEIHGYLAGKALLFSCDGTLEMLCKSVRSFLRISKPVQDALSKHVEENVRRSHPGPLPLDKDKDLKNFLGGSSGPLPLAGPRSTHEIDEIFARVHARAPWLSHATKRIWRHARGRAAAGVVGYSAPPFMLWGPGGTGKTELAAIIAEEAGAPSLEMDAGVGSAAFRITGVESGFSTRQIGEPLRLIAERGIANPIITINEVEKAMGGVNTTNGLNTSMISALLPMLEPSTAASFRCPASGLICDMSRISWMMTGNAIHMLPAPFLTRIEVIEVPGLSLEDYLQAADILCPDDPDVKSLVGRFVMDAHQKPGFSLRNIIRVIERLIPTKEGYLLH
ncbi:AAA family ATPase [Sulfitobacter sp. KE29]|uniref:AAA family ATPase n=1 Tax=Sulfitobacter TaxID=60136 RepID=UPI0023E2FAC9|nr:MULTISPECIES: AAA family ATPase [Sulfitobacter]MDF3420104.1 AAA family ATPase [Sulfitobacter sp. Ks38]MDF3427589.1 AAA family ATPase [Sulfitobacter sp. KE29]MDF3431168.1 AAA family ATPase [Sulfitobacter sp. S46]MDF3445941.1 AAA family ATPase [Sulfitobacter sp. KE31]MDF3549950.1 AAA family ATPase [Sulfitobacter sp. KE28]